MHVKICVATNVAMRTVWVGENYVSVSVALHKQGQRANQVVESFLIVCVDPSRFPKSWRYSANYITAIMFAKILQEYFGNLVWSLLFCIYMRGALQWV